MLRKYLSRDVRRLRKYTNDVVLAASQIHDVPLEHLLKNRRFSRVGFARRDVVRILLNTVRVNINNGNIAIKTDGIGACSLSLEDKLSSVDIADLLNLKSHASVLVILDSIKSDSDKEGNRNDDMTYTKFILQLQPDTVESS